MNRPCVALVFRDTTKNDLDILQRFIDRRVPVIPVFSAGATPDDFASTIGAINGLTFDGSDENVGRIVRAALDALGLLRQQRRVFISYRRNEASAVALQLHDHLSRMGFSVFLDTHAIRPGEFFQDSLWQNLCDSDVLLMLDTPKYFESQWTTEEFGKARSSQIAILRLVWPEHVATQEAGLSETIELQSTDFKENNLTTSLLDIVANRTETLRAKSIASRHTQITGKLLDEAKIVGAKLLGTGAYRAISLRLANNEDVWVYPIIGVPTANTMNDIAKKAAISNHNQPFLVYDEQGLTDLWIKHLDWLNDYIPEVDFMRVSEASNELQKRM